jgi:hypothetical protein
MAELKAEVRECRALEQRVRALGARVNAFDPELRKQRTELRDRIEAVLLRSLELAQVMDREMPATVRSPAPRSAPPPPPRGRRIAPGNARRPDPAPPTALACGSRLTDPPPDPA